MNTSPNPDQSQKLPKLKDIDFQKFKDEQRLDTIKDDTSHEDPEKITETATFKYDKYG